MPNNGSKGVFEVMSKRCDECLFSDAKIVSDKRKRAILTQTRRNQTHFICHKATIQGCDVACAGWRDEHGGESQLYRIALALDCVKTVSEAELIERGKK